MAKALLESNTGHQVQLVSADTVPNIMFNTVCATCCCYYLYAIQVTAVAGAQRGTQDGTTDGRGGEEQHCCDLQPAQWQSCHITTACVIDSRQHILYIVCVCYRHLLSSPIIPCYHI